MKLKDSVDKLEKAFNERAELVEQTALSARQLPDVDFLEVYDISNPGALLAEMPYNARMYMSLARDMRRYWRFKGKGISTTGDRRYAYFVNKLYGVSLCIIMIPELTGSTCSLRQVGERVEPVWEVVCHE